MVLDEYQIIKEKSLPMEEKRIHNDLNLPLLKGALAFQRCM